MVTSRKVATQATGPIGRCRVCVNTATGDNLGAQKIGVGRGLSAACRLCFYSVVSARRVRCLIHRTVITELCMAVSECLDSVRKLNASVFPWEIACD